jgi:predicted RNase H-like HicB family nuclease
MQKIYFVRAEWDEEAKVWVATSDDVPGLVTEAETMKILSSKLEIMIPELLAENGLPDKNEISYEVLARKFSVTHAISVN